MKSSVLNIGTRIYREVDSGVFNVNYSRINDFRPKDLPYTHTVFLTGIKLVNNVKLTIWITNGCSPFSPDIEWYSYMFVFESRVTSGKNNKKAYDSIQRLKNLLNELVIRNILTSPSCSPFSNWEDLPFETNVNPFSKSKKVYRRYTLVFYDSGKHLANIKIRDLVFQVLSKFMLTGNIIKVFLCHASEDKKAVELFAKKLSKQGGNVWFDKWEIKIGDSIVEKINDGLQSMTHLIVFVSTSSIEKPWFKKELSVALMRKLSDNSVIVIPILLDKVELPAIIKDIKYADCTNNLERAYNEVIKLLTNY
jgi:hypothetical protein